MNSNNYIPVATLGKPHGVSGAFHFYLLRKRKSTKKFPPFFLLRTQGTYLPFFIASCEWQNSESGLLKFDDIHTREEAKKYSGKPLFLSESDVAVYFAQPPEEFHFLIGYTLCDKEHRPIGTVTRIEESPAQTLAIVAGSSGKEHTIPLVEEWTVSVEKRKKEIILDLPEGLLDL